MKLYFTRHGETEWNVENRVQGTTDIPLNEKGLAQAEELALETVKAGIKPDIIYTSPLKRAQVTAETVASKVGCDVKPLDCLIEMSFGIYEGVTRDNMDYQRAKSDFFKRYPGGESYMDVAARIYPLLDKIKKGPYDSVMIVAHNGIARIVHSYFNDMENEAFRTFSIGNCVLMEYDF